MVEDYKTFWTDILSKSVTVFNSTVEGEVVDAPVEEVTINIDLQNALKELSVPTIDANLTEWLPLERSPGEDQSKPYQKLSSQYGAWKVKNTASDFKCSMPFIFVLCWFWISS